MLWLFSIKYVALTERSDAILSNAVHTGDKINIFSSGSLGFYRAGKCIQSYPNFTLNGEEDQDWCSNIVRINEKETGSYQKPYILFNLENKAMKLTGYSVRNGCCKLYCCCSNDHDIIEEFCCCRLYSFSLLGSNDNNTWKTIHSVVKDKMFRVCETKTFQIENEQQSFRFIKFQMDEEYPHCPICLQINQIELYGKTVKTNLYNEIDTENDDESVSIIGKIRKDEQQ